MPGAQKLRIAEQIAAVLVATHAAGVVHRDLKPGNVMLTRAGDVKVLDFGLSATRPGADSIEPDLTANEADDAPDAAADLAATHLPVARTGPAVVDGSHVHSIAGTVMGTVTYMSPEQARGEFATSASDMYSFGLLLQELFTGRPANEATTDYLVALDHARRGETRAATGLGADLTALINRLKAPAPALRMTAVDALERLRWIKDAPRRRLRNGIAAAIAGVLVLGAGKYAIDLSRERTLAVQAREEADRRRDQAEDLIGFMIGDLRPKLAQAGRLDLLDAVGDKATTYFAAVPADALSTAELHRRSQALHQLGQIRQARADLPAALAAYRESLQLASDVAAREPDNAEWQLGLAYAHFYVGDLLRTQATYGDAMREFVAYRDIAARLVAREPGNERFMLELADGRSGVAAVLDDQGDLEGARRELEAIIALRQTLLKTKPDDVERLQGLGTAHNRLGVVLDKLGHGEPALQHYLADLEIRQALVRKHPADRSIRRPLQVAHSYVGNAYEERGDLDAALVQYRAWLEVTTAQAEIDPQNADWARDLARAETRLGRLQQLRGHVDEAESRYRRALVILRPIAARAASNTVRRRDVADAELALGESRLMRRDRPAALTQAAAVDAVLEPLVATDVAAARLAAEARLLAGEALAASGKAADAQRQRQRAYDALAPMASRLTEKRALAAWVQVLLALDRRDEARPAFERLKSIGYRHPVLLRAWNAGQGS